MIFLVWRKWSARSHEQLRSVSDVLVFQAGLLPFHPAISPQPWWGLSEKINWSDPFCCRIFAHHRPPPSLLLLCSSSASASHLHLLFRSVSLHFLFFCPFTYRLATFCLSIYPGFNKQRFKVWGGGGDHCCRSRDLSPEDQRRTSVMTGL